MSFFAGGNGSGHHHGHGHNNHSSARSTANHNNFERGSVFGGSTRRPGYARSSSSGIFSRGGSSSFYKRRPRDGYVAYLIAKLKRLIAELWAYARKHPLKAFLAVVVPLVSAGGAVHGLLKQFGIKLPLAFDGTTRTYRGGYYGSRGYTSEHGSGYTRGGGAMESMGSLFKIAQAFM